MNTMPIRIPEDEPRLAEVFREVLDLPAGAPVETLGRASCPEWDSLRHVKLMLELQKRFGVRFSATDLLRLSTYAEIRDELSRRK